MSDPVFQALVESNRRLTETVENKTGEIDQRMDAAEVEFDEWRQLKDVIGDPNGYGTMRMNVAQGIILRTRSESPSAAGVFQTTDLGTEGNVYLHFKTPLNVNVNNEMFWFNIRGYSFGSAAIIDETLTGYCYSASVSITNKSCFGGMNPDVYADSSGNVILRILVPNVYYTTVRIDSMRVGNGRLFKVGDLQAVQSLSETIEF